MKATELWNIWFTVDDVIIVKCILTEKSSEPMRGRQWMKLRRDDNRSKSVQAHNSCERLQTNRQANTPANK